MMTLGRRIHRYIWMLLGSGACLMLLILLGSRKQGVSSNAERLQYLSEAGWEVESAPVSVQRVTLPEEFPPVLLDYNRLQKEQGFDLLPYAGKEVTIYIYKTAGELRAETVYCCLYVYEDKVVGGDAHTASLNGFMVGLRQDLRGGD